MKAVLTIAGHDLSNGAGITKDLEVFASLGLHGLSVPTCAVIQGPRGATGLVPVSDDLFDQMLRKVREDFSLSGIKIGVIPEAYHVRCLLGFLASLKAIVVLDPVGSTKNGVRVMTDEARRIIEEDLLRHLTCITPNIDEASQLTGRRINDLAGMEWAARELVGRGAKNAVIKGGHLPGRPVDLLFDGSRVTTYEKKRIDKNVHGTGCLFSSTLLSFLAMEYPMAEAFRETERAVERLLQESEQPLEDGYFYASPVRSAIRHGERWWCGIAAAESR